MNELFFQKTLSKEKPTGIYILMNYKMGFSSALTVVCCSDFLS